jgi:hypothetical protein
LVALTIYLWTLAPTVLGADSGRFQTRAFVLGIGHPTGYPTYIMLGKLFTYLPFGDVAYRVNLSSAVYAALTVFFLYFIARRLAGPLPAIVACLAFAVSRTFWSHAVIAEVYTLNTLFICATVATLLRWREVRQDRYLLLAALLCGLSLTNHMTSGLLIPAALLLVWLTDRSRLLNWRLLLGAGGLFLLGLTPYLYLPIRAAMDPPLNYGDPSTLERFIQLVTGGKYKGSMWAFGLRELPEREAMYWVDLRAQYNIVLLALAVVGVVWGFRRRRIPWLVLMLLFLGQLIYALEYDIWDIHVYFLPTYLVMAIWMAWGTRALLEWGGSWLRERRRDPRLLAAVPLALLLLIGSVWHSRYPEVDQSRNLSARKLIEKVTALPEGSSLYDPNSLGALSYMTHVEGRGRGVKRVETLEEPAAQLLERELAAGRPFYLIDRRHVKTFGSEYLPLREGGLWRLVRNNPADAMLATPAFLDAAEWLKNSVGDGAVITNPGADEALRALGLPKVLPAYTARDLEDPKAVPADERPLAREVRGVYAVAGSASTGETLRTHNVRYLLFVKSFPIGLQRREGLMVAWTKHRNNPWRYEPVFENRRVIVFRWTGA